MQKQTSLKRKLLTFTRGRYDGRVFFVWRYLSAAPVFFYTRTRVCARAYARVRGAAFLAVWTLLLLAVIGINLARPAQTTAATSGFINFQARLESISGAIVPDGNYNVEFKLYSASSGGSAQWTEDYTYNSGPGSSDVRIKVVNGYLTANLGSITSFPGTINWDQQEWLTMNIGGTGGTGTFPTMGDGEMSPRLQLTGVPYAFRAGQLALLTGANTSTLGWATQSAANSLLLPNEGGTLCVQASVNCGFAAGSGSASYIQNQNASPQSAANFNIAGSGTASTSFIAPTYTGSGAVSLSSGGATALSLTSGAALNLTGAANSTWDLGAAHTLSLQTTNNGPITTGTGLLTVGGNLNFNQAATLSSNTPSTSNAAGFALTVAAGTANSSTTGNVGGALTLRGGNAAGTAANNGGNLILQGGTPSSTGTGGSVIVQPQAGGDSTTAFQVQNAGGAGTLLNVDTLNSNLTLLGNNSPKLGAFASASNTLPAIRAFHGTVTANGYVYVVGGDNGSGPQSTIFYAPLGTNGAPGTWSCQGVSTAACGGSLAPINGNTLPSAREDVSATVVNGYIYVVGSSATTGDDATNVVYYARLNADGSTGPWTNQTTNLLNTARTEFGLVSANGYLYATAGYSGTNPLASTEYTKLNADGSTGPWTATTSLPVGKISGATAIANGYVYVLGGVNAGTYSHSVMFASLNSNGTLGTWKCQGSNIAGECGTSPAAVNSNAISGSGISNNGVAVANGYIYSIAGHSGSSTLSAINYGLLNADGTTGSWNSTTSLTSPATASEAFGYMPVMANGYIYVIGGSNAGNKNSVYYASVPRLQVSGVVDLVGISGETLTNGATASELVAGTTTVVGTLSVRDNASFAQGVSIGGALTVSGNAQIQTTTNSTNAFSVQNAAGASVFQVDTTSTAANGTTVNYLTYPGFESGSFSNASAGWTSVSSTLTQNTTKANTYNGLVSAKAVTSATNGGLTTSSFVSAPPIGTYQVSFYVEANSGTLASNSFTITSTDGTSHTCTPAAGTTINTSGFQRLFCSTPITTTGVMTALQITYATSGTTFFIDAVQLQSTTFNGGSITAPTPYDIGGIQLRGVIQNPVSILPNANSTSVFQIFNAAGTSALLNADTLNTTLSLGTTGSTAVASTVNIASSTGATQAINIGSTSSSTVAAAGTTVSIQGGTATSAISIGTTASVNKVLIGSTNTTSSTTIQAGSGGIILAGPAYTTSSQGVQIGSATLDGTIVLLDPDISNTQGAETAGNCSTTINPGGIYYSAATASSNTTTNEVRGCINGKWTDVVTGDQLGILLFGVEEGSGTTIGDISGIAGYTSSPCKVTWATTTSVTVAPCTAYSGGRKVVISSAVTVTTAGTASSTTFQHICLTGTNGAPAATAANTSETAAVPTWSASAPILCLATVKLNTTPNISNIYDTRVFTTSAKEYATSSTAVAPGMIEVIDTTGTANTDKTIAVAQTAGVRGIVAVGNTTGSTSTINSIVVIHGPAFAKATGTVTLAQAAQTSGTLGYSQSAASVGAYKDIGLILDVGSTAACTTAANCQFSVLIDVSPH